MKDENKTKKQPINELTEVRQRIAESETSETERKRAEQALRESEEKFRGLAEKSLVGVYLIQDGVFKYVNPRVAEIFGYTVEELINKKGPKDLVLPEDWPIVEENLRKRISGEVKSIHYDFRGITKNKETIYVEVYGSRTMYQEQPAVIGTLLDITERKQAEETLRKRMEQTVHFQTALLELAKMGISDLDSALRRITEADSKTLGVERVSVWLFNKNRSEIICKDLYKLSKNFHEEGLRLQAKHYPRYFEALKKSRTIAANDARTDPCTNEFTQGYLKPFGITSMMDAPVWLHRKVVGIVCHEHTGPRREWTLEEQDFAASIAHMVSLALEASEHKRAEEEIKRLYEKAKEMADRDPLTGLFNHRRINELLEHEIERAKRKADIFSIMMLDVDDLKLVNDTHGHVVGDKLLKDVAVILKNSSRSVDSMGRYGGDEFLMILPYTDGEKAKALAQRISKRMKQKGLKIDEKINIPIRLSIGVATYPYDSMISRELVALADRGMYESKRSGKNAVYTTMPEVSEFLAAKTPSFRILQGLVAAVDSKDYYTRAHSDLVTNYALSLAKEIGLSHEQTEALKIAGLLHDIGKIGIPDTILRKPGPLKRGEYNIIKQHPELGAMMLSSPPPHREHVLGAIMYHHERYNGKGYPGKLKGKDIPLLARIIGIVDAYSAMITDRPYRKALTKDQAIEELKKGAGTQFDPDLVSKFIECLKEGKS